jgi:hypothetical protein
MTILPPFPNLIICFAAACAVMKTPVTLTENILLVSYQQLSLTIVDPLLFLGTNFASAAVYSKAGVSC